MRAYLRLGAVCLFAVAAAVSVEAQNINLLSDESGLILNRSIAATSEEGLKLDIPVGGSVGNQGESARGLTGFQFGKKNDYYVSLLYSVGDDLDEEGRSEDFGEAVLNPGGQGRSFALSGIKYGSERWGWGGRVEAVSSTWSATLEGEPQEAEGWIVGFSPALQYRIVPPTAAGENEVEVAVELSPAVRLLAGDLGQKDSEALRSDDAVLGSDDTIFYGLELTFFGRINQIRPYLRLTWFDAQSDVDGLTGFQVLLGADALSAIRL